MRAVPSVLACLSLTLWACGDPASARPDAAGEHCALSIDVGQGSGEDFVALEDGDPVELVLGFQGFRMLQFALQVAGTDAATADVIAYMTVPELDQELDQRDRALALQPAGEAVGRIDDYLLFVNDIAAPTLIGSEARLELIVRADGCEGSALRRLVLRDDDACVDFDVVLDAAVPVDVPDASVACE